MRGQAGHAMVIVVHRREPSHAILWSDFIHKDQMIHLVPLHRHLASHRRAHSAHAHIVHPDTHNPRTSSVQSQTILHRVHLGSTRRGARAGIVAAVRAWRVVPAAVGVRSRSRRVVPVALRARLLVRASKVRIERRSRVRSSGHIRRGRRDAAPAESGISADNRVRRRYTHCSMKEE